MLTKISLIFDSVIMYNIYGVPFKIWLFIGTGFAIMWQIRFDNIIRLPEAIKYAFSSKKNEDHLSSGVGAITALMSQLAGNLGVGNFAGSAFALYYGGPGVIFWFFVLSFFCSAIKFGEVVLAHKFRTIENNEIKGGSFYFIQNALNIKYPKFKIPIKILAILSAVSVLTIAVSSGAMQFNQINTLIFSQDGNLEFSYPFMLATIITGALIGIILFGGLKKIGAASDILVPIMGLMYVISCITIIIMHYKGIVPALHLISAEMLNFKAATITAMVIALNRIISSTDTGAGFSAISQSNSKLKSSGQQGMVSFFDPFIVATIISVGAFAILVVDVPYKDPNYLGLLAIKQVFISVSPKLEYLLIAIAYMFGFTTIMAVGFYVQQACIYLFGSRLKKIYIVIYIFLYTYFGVNDAKATFTVLDLAYSIGLINLIAMLFLLPEIKVIWDEFIENRSRK